MSIGPVEIDFALKNINFGQEAAKMKEEIKGVNDYTQAAAKAMNSAMGDFATQSAKQMKESIAIQKTVIKDLQQSIKELQDTANNSTGKNKTDAKSALGIAKSDLVAEQGALIAMQKEQTALNAREAESQIPIIGGLGAWAVGLMSVAAAMKIGKDIIESTEGSAKQFEYSVAAAQSGLSYFWSTLVTGDFTNFFENMKNAIDLGHKFAEMTQEVKEAKWAQSMDESAMLKTNTQLEIDLRNSDLSKEARLKAGEDRIKNEQTLSDGRIAIANKELTVAMGIAENRSHLDTEQFDASKRLTDSTYLEKFKLLNILKEVDNTTKQQAEEYNTNGDREKAAVYLNDKAIIDNDKKNGREIPAQYIAALVDEKRAYETPEAVKMYADAGFW